MRLDDPGVSEVQALISLRGRHLKLLCLRGRLRVGKSLTEEVVLQDGLSLQLTKEVAIEVLEVHLPEHALGLHGFGPLPVELVAPVYSVRPGPTIQPTYDPEALAWVWSTDTGWRIRVGANEPEELAPGGRWTIDGHVLEAMAIPLGEIAVPDTRRARQERAPLRMVCRNDTVHLQQEGRRPVVIDGLPARILTELAEFDAPTPWDWVAREIWGEDLDPFKLRQRWDRNLRRLRKALKGAGLDPQLVRSDGSGNVELVVRASDEVVQAD